MTLITIRETAGITDSPNAMLSFDNIGQYPITISNPLSLQDERRLEWYFEEYLNFPFLDEVKFRDAEKSIPKYGQALFEQLFGDRKAYGRYSQARQEGVEKLRFEIIGSPEFFHKIHWETLKDPDWPAPFVLDAPLVRTTFQPPVVEAHSQESPTINLLIVTARPGKSDVGYRTISLPLVEGLRNAGMLVKIVILRPGTYEALSKHLDAERDEHGQGHYHIIHFDLHGSLATHDQLMQGSKDGRILLQARYGRADYPAYEGQKAFLFFESDKPGQSDPAEAREIAELLQKHSIPIAVLNACQSGKTAATEASLGSRLMEAGMQAVVAMSYSVTVSAAALMMTELYRQLFAGQDLNRAICHARKALHDNKNRQAYYNQTIELEDWMLPVVYQSGGAQAKQALKLREFKTSEEEKEYWQNHGRLYHAPETTYGFVGRDLDVLEVERRLLATSEGERRNMLLVQGMGGSGKTTLLRHLMKWWQTTGFVQQVFYFGYDERAWKADQIMDRLARDLLANKLDVFRALDPASQREMLGQKMRSERHLLVLDNMESITGTSLSIKNTLDPEQQDDLRALLAEMLGGESLVLLGSRGPEEWLAQGPNAPLRSNDVYHLPGLDDQAASTLAERVLERHVADDKKREGYRKSEEFQWLMKLLDGYPLPIQVVLANLASQSPDQVLEALKEGGIVQDSAIKDKTESIMLCIEYSLGNLAPEDQRVLLALAPFTGVVYQPALGQYIEHLRQQPALKDLPFERWDEALQQARDWGLVTADQIEGYLRLQPVLPYFLRTRLNQEPETRLAIENAYRAYYDGFAGKLISLMKSNEPQEKQFGQALAGHEYENLYNALDLDLKAKVSVLNSYGALSQYISVTQEHERGLKIAQKVLDGLENYSLEALKGPIGKDRLVIVDDIAKCQLLLKRYADAWISYQKALELLEGSTSLDDKTKALGKAGIYNQLGLVSKEERKWSQAEQYYQKALEIFIEFDDRHGQASTYDNLGNLAQEQRMWQQAEQYYQKALEIFIEFDDRHGQAITYNNLGKAAMEQRLWEQAEKCYHKAIEFEDLSDQANTYHQMGKAVMEQGLWQQAEKRYKKALEIAIKFNNYNKQADIYEDLGTVAGGQKMWQQAEQYYQKARGIYIKFDDRYRQAGIYNNLGNVAQEQGKWSQAEQYYQKAIEIFIEFDDSHGQASTYNNLGSVAQEQRQWDIAGENFLKALEIFIEFGDQYRVVIALSNLARLWLANKDPRLLAEVARILNITQENAKKLLEGEAEQ